VAKISPSGYYCASADVSGTVRVWDLAGTEQILKIEVKALGGKITDLVWDGESKRIGVVGEGKDKFGHFFLIDSASSCGEVTGHSKVTNTIAIKTTRPYRAVTAGDDGTLVFYNGVPFKYSKSISTHKSFVQCVAYALDGSVFVSVGSDGRAFLYDGTTGDVQSALSDAAAGDLAHKGTIFSCAISSDSSQIVTCGADGFLKLWEIKGTLIKSIDLNGKNTVVMANGKADDQLVGCTFAQGSENAVAISLAGEINVVDVKSGEISKMHGATKSISAASLARSAEGDLVAGE
jgi:WD40 repeat protein